MRNINKSKAILLPLFIDITKNKGFINLIKKTNLVFSLYFLKQYFFLYNGYSYNLTRVRLPFSFIKVSSFIQCRPSFDLIPARFKRLALKKLPNKQK